MSSSSAANRFTQNTDAALAARDPAFPGRVQAAAREAKLFAVPDNLLEEAERRQREGDFTRASRLLERVLENDSKDQRALVGLGGIRRSQGKLYESVLLYQRALKIDSQDAQAHYGLGKTFSELGWVQTAEAHLRLALEVSPTFVSAFVCLSSCLLEQGRYREAIVACQEAILLVPDCQQAHRNLEIALSGEA